MEVAQKRPAERYDELDVKRKKTEARAADEEAIKVLEAFGKNLTKREQNVGGKKE